MSHFSVTITGAPDTFEDRMAPYAEQDARKEFLKFEDNEDEHRKEYETDTRQEFYCNSSSSHGQVVREKFFAQVRGLNPGAVRTITFDKSDLDTMHYFKLNQHYHLGLQKADHSYPDEQVWVKVTAIKETNHPDPHVCFEGTITLEVVNPPREILLKDTYATFEEFMAEWVGQKQRDPEVGRYGYWTNPNAKWDYWRIGGRWAGHWLIKPEFQSLYTGNKPEFGWEWETDERARKDKEKILAECRVDSALKGHIDFEKMMEGEAEKAAQRYDFVTENIFRGTPENEPWGENFYNRKGGREEYHAQPRVVAWDEYIKANGEACNAHGLSVWSSLEDFNVSRDQYIRTCRFAAVSTFALLDEGKWAARGEMGWWAVVSDEQDSWEETYWKLLAAIPDDTRLTVLDCHI